MRGRAFHAACIIYLCSANPPGMTISFQYFWTDMSVILIRICNLSSPNLMILSLERLVDLAFSFIISGVICSLCFLCRHLGLQVGLVLNSPTQCPDFCYRRMPWSGSERSVLADSQNDVSFSISCILNMLFWTLVLLGSTPLCRFVGRSSDTHAASLPCCAYHYWLLYPTSSG